MNKPKRPRAEQTAPRGGAEALSEDPGARDAALDDLEALRADPELDDLMWAMEHARPADPGDAFFTHMADRVMASLDASPAPAPAPRPATLEAPEGLWRRLWRALGARPAVAWGAALSVAAAALLAVLVWPGEPQTPGAPTPPSASTPLASGALTDDGGLDEVDDAVDDASLSGQIAALDEETLDSLAVELAALDAARLGGDPSDEREALADEASYSDALMALEDSELLAFEAALDDALRAEDLGGLLR